MKEKMTTDKQAPRTQPPACGKISDASQACEVPLEEQLSRIPVDARLTWTEVTGLKATHFVPVGVLAHRAATELRAYRLSRHPAPVASVEPKTETCKTCGDTKIVQDVVDSIDPEWSRGVEYPCPDCSHPSRRAPVADERAQTNTEAERAAPAGPRDGLLSPPPERAPGGDAIPNCGCREAGCPHTPVVQLSREELVATYKARIRDLEKKLEAEICRPQSSSPSATADATLRAALELHRKWEALPIDRGGARGPKGRAYAAFIAARDAALAGNEGEK